MLVPVLDEIICGAADRGTRHTMIGMAHRGRLNVLAHVLQKPYAQILAEFKDPVSAPDLRVDQGWMGDVKYHAGARTSAPRGQMHVDAARPTRATSRRSTRWSSAWHAPPAPWPASPGAPRFDGARTLPVLIHGDAAFPGQGVVAETLNLSRLPGYDTDGTIHIIANNQLGFTATPAESYSTSYASGLARGFKIPIVHVNADDPVACLEAARLAWEYRARFRRDFLIDLVGYRRYGHNEGDEPAFTQPVMYRKVAAHPTVRELFAAHADRAGHADAGAGAEAIVKKHFAALEKALASLKPEEDFIAPMPEPVPAGIAGTDETGVPLERLREINDALLHGAAGLHVPQEARTRPRAPPRRARQRRTSARSTGPTAEELALATILADGMPIRFTGEDVERGTFSHRHAVYPRRQDRQAVRAAAGASRRRAPRSRSTTARSARTPPSASSSATTSRRRTGWSSGKRSTATSSTARR